MKKRFLLFLIFCLTLAANSWSQPRDRFYDANRLIRSMDDNDDHLISGEEARCFHDDFVCWDKNDDGFLDKREEATYIRREHVDLPCFVGPCWPTFE